MNADVKQRMEALLASSGGLVLQVFVEELIEDSLQDFMKCNKDTFDIQKGKIQAYQTLLNHVQQARRKNNG